MVVFYNCSMFCYALLYVDSSFVIILMRKRELVALLSVSSWCVLIVVWLFLAVPWVCLQFVIAVFPNPTHYFNNKTPSNKQTECSFFRTITEYHNGRNNQQRINNSGTAA